MYLVQVLGYLVIRTTQQTADRRPHPPTLTHTAHAIRTPTVWSHAHIHKLPPTAPYITLTSTARTLRMPTRIVSLVASR